MQDSIFTKIIRGEVPCHKVYEDDRVFAFLDIHPLQPGHTLVIPKVQVPFAWDLDEPDFIALNLAAQKIARRIREVMQQPYVGEMIVGTDVPHTHIHLVPFDLPDQLHASQDMTTEPDHTALAEIAAKLAF